MEQYIGRVMLKSPMIMQVAAEREESEGCSTPSENFFDLLHFNEAKFSRLRLSRKSKLIQQELTDTILALVSSYTECIDYFGSIGQTIATYFQLKIKDVNRFYQSLTNKTATNEQIGQQQGDSKDLGSISEMTCPDLQPEEMSTGGKEALTQNLMAELRSQDIASHIKDKMKKAEKVQAAVASSIRQQEQTFLQRRRLRNQVTKTKVSQSFSGRAASHHEFFSRPKHYEADELIFIDMEALDMDSPQKLRQFASAREREKKQLQESAIRINVEEEDDGEQ